MSYKSVRWRTHRIRPGSVFRADKQELLGRNVHLFREPYQCQIVAYLSNNSDRWAVASLSPGSAQRHRSTVRLVAIVPDASLSLPRRQSPTQVRGSSRLTHQGYIFPSLV